MWEQIKANRRRSMVLIAALILLPLFIGWFFGGMVSSDAAMVGLGVAAVFLMIMLPIGWFGGKAILLNSVDARPITHDDSPRLFNVVQEMTLAAGLPKPPQVYIIDCDAPNAFALGSPDNAAVAVTSGLLMRLNRDELQGVIAHEIAHIANEDSEFMTLAATLVGITASLSNLAQRGMYFNGGRRRSSRGDGRNAGLLMLLGLIVIILAPFMARMLYLACSRRREFLADACAARFTRYPEGLASALEKIAADTDMMQHVGRDVAALCIINPFRDEGDDLFSTHPSTTQRVKVLRAMAGAGLGEYERAFRLVTGDQAIGARSLRQATPEAIRPPTVEPETGTGAMTRARETVDILHRNEGALFVDCECGVRIKRPPGAAGVTVLCPRCGKENTLPLAMPVKTDDGERPAFVYQPGRWQSFQCSCGGAIQLSPNFLGAQVSCPRCGAVTEVIREEETQTQRT